MRIGRLLLTLGVFIGAGQMVGALPAPVPMATTTSDLDAMQEFDKRNPGVILRAWFKIAKVGIKAYLKAVEANDKKGAGFHRDFEELIAQLPEPPAGTDQDAAPN